MHSSASTERVNPPPNRLLAIIIGSGIGGLGAAAAIAPFFGKIILIEKDKLPQDPSPRKGVPQGAHLHSLLLGGLKHLECFYPGFGDLLMDNGAVQIRAGIDQKIFEQGQWLPERDLGLTILSQSRALLEHLVRKQTLNLKNVEILQECRLETILLDDKNSITGIDYLDSAGRSVQLTSNIVIDCSGLGGHFVKQLAQKVPGIDRTESLQSNIAYTTCILKKPAAWQATKENVLVIPEVHTPAGGALLDIEDDSWCVSLHGRNGRVPPTDIDDWKEYARTQLPTTAIWERIKDAEVIGKPSTFRKPTSIWRRFDLAEELPAGYYPLGDTISSLNPIFGQGMTVALGHAISLREAFQNYTQPQRPYIQTAAEWSRKAWQRVKAYDSMFCESPEITIDASLIRKLALARHKQFSENPQLYREAVLKSQMLFT